MGPSRVSGLVLALIGFAGACFVSFWTGVAYGQKQAWDDADKIIDEVFANTKVGRRSGG